MSSRMNRAVIALDGTYAVKCDFRFTLGGHGRKPETLAEYEAVLAALNHETAMPRFRLEHRILQLRDECERARALSCVAPLPFSHHE